MDSEVASTALDQMSDVDSQLTPSHAMAYSNKRTGHLRTEMVNHMEEISTMIIPRSFHSLSVHGLVGLRRLTVVAQLLFVDCVTPALMCYICNPYAPDTET